MSSKIQVVYQRRLLQKIKKHTRTWLRDKLLMCISSRSSANVISIFHAAGINASAAVLIKNCLLRFISAECAGGNRQRNWSWTLFWPFQLFYRQHVCFHVNTFYGWRQVSLCAVDFFVSTAEAWRRDLGERERWPCKCIKQRMHSMPHPGGLQLMFDLAQPC